MLYYIIITLVCFADSLYVYLYCRSKIMPKQQSVRISNKASAGTQVHQVTHHTDAQMPIQLE